MFVKLSLALLDIYNLFLCTFCEHEPILLLLRLGSGFSSAEETLVFLFHFVTLMSLCEYSYNYQKQYQDHFLLLYCQISKQIPIAWTHCAIYLLQTESPFK